MFLHCINYFIVNYQDTIINVGFNLIKNVCRDLLLLSLAINLLNIVTGNEFKWVLVIFDSSLLLLVTVCNYTNTFYFKKCNPFHHPLTNNKSNNPTINAYNIHVIQRTVALSLKFLIFFTLSHYIFAHVVKCYKI